MIKKNLFLLLLAFQSLCAIPLADLFKQTGYIEIEDESRDTSTYDSLYGSFDDLIAYLQKNPKWEHIFFQAKERFIRSKERNAYSTDFFGYFDESTREGRRQVSFYYATHFHEFFCSHYPQCKKIPEIIRFLENCQNLQKTYNELSNEIAAELGLKNTAILLKVIKYLPSYTPSKAHYDGSAFTFLLDSTDNQSLLLSPYKASFTIADFISPERQYNMNSLLIIPGIHLTELDIYPTPHIVIQNGRTRYAAIAFIMRPDILHQKHDFPSLPSFKH